MPARGRIGRFVIVASAYVLFAQVGLTLASANENITAFWPAAGIALAALLLWGNRMWPAIALGAIAANLFNGLELHLSLAVAVGNTLAPLVGATLLRKAGLRHRLRRVRDVTLLMVTSGSAMAISAVLGTLSLTLGGALDPDRYARALLTWWVGDTMGAILLAPILLIIASTEWKASRILARPLEATAVFASAVVIILVILSSGDQRSFRYLVIPIAVWAAVRFEDEGAAGMLALLPAIAIWHTFHSGGTEADLLLLQTLNAVFAAILLYFAAFVTERRRAQDDLRRAAAKLEERIALRTAELRASETRLADAQRIAHIGSFHWDAATDTNTWTDELYRIYQLDPGDEAPTFETYLSFVDPSYREETEAAVGKAIASREPLTHEYPVVLADGTRKWMLANVQVSEDPEGNLLGLHGTCQDITARKLADEALRVSEEKFRTLLAAGPDAVLTADATGTIKIVNDETTKLLGYTADELIGRSVEILLPETIRSRHERHRAGFMEDPHRRPMAQGEDLCAIHKDGSRIPVDVSLSPVSTPEGPLVIASIRDATERRNVEDALRAAFEQERKAAEDLRILDQSKNAFLSAVSHELRTPLTSILGFTELLRYPGTRWDDGEGAEIVDRIETNARRLYDLLNDLLDLNRLQRGVIEPKRRATPVFEMIEESIDGLDVHDHLLRFEVSDSTAMVDRPQTERIVQNLVHNAIKYTPAGTTITVAADTDEDGGLHLTVSDDGPGIPEHIRDSLFDPFTRAGEGEFTQGTGIGLALVDHFSRLHGGRAWATETPGGGACFHVELPGVNPQEASSPAA